MATQRPCPCARSCERVDRNAPFTSGGTRFRFKRGDILWRQGDPAMDAVFLCTGTLKLVRRWVDGAEIILELVHRGDVAGEEAVVAGAHHPAACVAVSSGKGMRVSRAALESLLRDRPALARPLLEAAVARSAALARRLELLERGRAEQRLARAVLGMADRVGIPDGRGRFVPVPLSRGELASMVGCRVETAIRVMRSWQRKGWVETQREGLVVRDARGLGGAAQA